jgi:CBS domain-containing protein
MTLVEQLMSQPAIACHRRDTLMVAAALMLEHDCGAIPITVDDNRLVGILTDRDVCMAAYTESMSLRHIPVSDVMRREVVRCNPGDTIRHAAQLMRQARIRRLPVVDEEERVVGLLSLTDLVRESAHRLLVRDALSASDLVATLAEVSRPRRPVAMIEHPLHWLF